MNQNVIEKQHATVLAVARAVRADWKRIACGYEVEESDESIVEDTIVAFVHEKDGELHNDSLSGVPNAITEAFYDLRAAMLPPSGTSWSSADVTIEADGTYKFHFSYGAPKRINGTFDDDSNSKFAKLAGNYKAERASGK